MPPLATGDNRVINADFRIDQRNNGASGTADGYTVDRWGFSATSGKMQWGRKLNSANDLATSGFAYSLSIATTTPYTPVGSDTFQLYQPIEADMVSDFAWGTSAAQPVTLSFWVNSTVATGSFGGVVQNYSAPHRTYPFTFSVPSANTWTKIVVVIPGDTAGTWAMSGNAGAFFLLFDLGSGPSQRGPAGAWASATYNGANGTVSPVAASGGNVFFTGVKLEIGSVATPFNRKSLAASMADCQRYFFSSGVLLLNGYSSAGNGIYASYSYPVQMRTPIAPTFLGTTYTNASALTTTTPYVGNFGVQALVTATGSALVSFQAQTSAEL